MRAVVIARHGAPDVLRVEERPEPSVGPGQLLLDVRAVGINFADLMARVGLYPDAPKPPSVVGYEVAGVVTALGEGVTGFAVGDRVMAGTRFGGYVEQIAVAAEDAIPLPDRLSFEQGAAVPVNYVTAWAALVRFGALLPGERVLIHAAAGGVGIAATQIAKRYGAEVYGTASPAKHGAIRGFGVDHALEYGPRGLPPMDIVLDAIGGASFRASYDALRPGGRLVAFGASAVMSGEKRNLLAAVRAALRMPRFNLISQMSDSKAVIGLNMLRLWDSYGTLAPFTGALRELLDDGTIQPVVAEAFPFAQAAEAHRYLSERRNIGKVVLVP
jgi:NADPH:quinone reductase-like Zn-dependent oxidoreductase